MKELSKYVILIPSLETFSWPLWLDGNLIYASINFYLETITTTIWKRVYFTHASRQMLRLQRENNVLISRFTKKYRFIIVTEIFEQSCTY